MVIFVHVFSTVTVLSADEEEAATVTRDSRTKSGVRGNGRTGASRSIIVSGLPASPQEATKFGSKYYFTGKPCRNGHLSPRSMRGLLRLQ